MESKALSTLTVSLMILIVMGCKALSLEEGARQSGVDLVEAVAEDLGLEISHIVLSHHSRNRLAKR